MRRILFSLCISSGFLVSGCGGGGSSGGDGVASTPPPPMAVNSTLSDLKHSQTFTNDATENKMVIDRVTGTSISNQAGSKDLSVRYDAANKSYTVITGGREVRFDEADKTASDNYDTQYTKSEAGGRDYLTLVKTPYSGTAPTKYVGLGYLQRTAINGDRQSLDFTPFTYGLPTAASAVPKTGTAAFRIDVFGAVSAPGSEPRAFQGPGSFSVDFSSSVFSAQSYLQEFELLSGDSVLGGGIELTASGKLSSTGAFYGNALYQGWFGSAGGTLNGRFYGPTAEEIGASFWANSGNGISVAGAFTGQRDSSLTPANLTLTNLTRPQLFFAQYGNGLVGQLNYQNSETFSLSPPTSDLYGGQFTSADKVASADPNFVRYRKTFSSAYDSQEVVLDLYRPGNANSQLKLTYASFGHWSTTVPYGTGRQPVDLYFAYGLETPARLLSGRTGSGRYQGVVYGTGSTGSEGLRYSVEGTALFNVDFSAQSLNGALTMTGKPLGSGSNIDFGAFDFAGRLAAFTSDSAFGLNRAGVAVGRITTRFFGPDGEEIAGPFSVNVPSEGGNDRITITGVAAAKRQ